jgi:hypothetical protein
MKKQNSKSKKITVSEFKMWLDGFLAFQGDEWVPTKEQWDVIVEKINNLSETSLAPKLIPESNRIMDGRRLTASPRNYERDTDEEEVPIQMPRARLMDAPPQQQSPRMSSTKDFVEKVEVDNNGIPKSPFV